MKYLLLIILGLQPFIWFVIGSLLWPWAVSHKVDIGLGFSVCLSAFFIMICLAYAIHLTELKKEDE